MAVAMGPRMPNVARSLALPSALVLSAAAGCIYPQYSLPEADGSIGVGGSEAMGASGAGATSGAGASGPSEGLPCEIAELLTAHCRSCHSPGGATPMLVTHADLVAPSSDPSRTVAELSLARMKDAADPMPPGALAAQGVVATFEAWVLAGTPEGSCGATGGAGADGGGGGGAGDPPAATVCTSDLHWTDGDEGSGNMHPGAQCISCHADLNEGPRYLVAGTVYPTLHEPDDCFGASGEVVVEITDASDAVFTLGVNAAGNFSRGGDPGTIAFPVKARVIRNGSVLEMSAPIDAEGGDCNRCHTEQGDQGAPGRILVP